ncbi:hypothetical protein G7Y89_g5930 [Cudoniella acicularis]|uniref:Uncharacterized protein n=1 Tax=Cudoniella acicularis TaxID=354080 RepID=A0A8H4W611_9HELO|nr:hypothetical protein G7Y89_g5930 [Cudoniella acicularis]
MIPNPDPNLNLTSHAYPTSRAYLPMPRLYLGSSHVTHPTKRDKTSLQNPIALPNHEKSASGFRRSRVCVLLLGYNFLPPILIPHPYLTIKNYFQIRGPTK